MSGTVLSWRIWLILALFHGVECFTTTTTTTTFRLPSTQTVAGSDTALFAAKKKAKKKKPAGPSFGGFGGAAMEPCPCGSGETYSNCCSKIHRDVQNFRKASAEQIVRARYSAYSKKLPEFLMMTTHPNNKAFNPDLRAWKESIK